jgi:ribosome maturation factor RimP
MVLKPERKGKEKLFFDLCTQVVKENMLEIYDLDYFPGQSLLRIFIYNIETETATLDDCAKIDRALTPFIESEDWMPKELNLEISSPGIYRSLNSVEHFYNSIGKSLSVLLCKKLGIDSFTDLPKKLLNTKKINGLLIECNETEILLESKENKLKLQYSEIKKANIEN